MTKLIHPQAKPFHKEGGKRGILLVHGFTSSPTEVAWLGEELNRRGFTVAAPLLSGHGTTPEDLQETKRQEWIEDVIRARDGLLQECDEVFILGVSMGGLLSLMACDHPQVRGVAVMAAPIYLRKTMARFSPWLYPLRPYAPKASPGESKALAEGGRFHYDRYPVKAMGELVRLIGDVKKKLPHLDKPLLIFQSAQDDLVLEKSAHYLFEGAASSFKGLYILSQPGHILTMGPDKELIRDLILAWIDVLVYKEEEDADQHRP